MKVLDNMKKLLTNIWVPFTADQVDVWRELNAELAKSCSGWGCLMSRGGRSWLPWGCRRGTGMPALMVMCRPYGIVEELPECGETIGGTSHMLLDTNRIATHMDGATRSSYRWGVPEQ